jgi:hypothetical protein
MPTGGNDPTQYYFVIAPDTFDTTISSAQIYRGEIRAITKNGVKIGSTLYLFNAAGARVFPKAEVIAGSGSGTRVLLNDIDHIVLSIGTPITTASLPPEEQARGFSYSYKASTPPNRAFQTPNIQVQGMEYLRGVIDETITGALEDEDITSSLIKERQLHEVVDYRLLLLFAIVEHMDIVLESDANNPGKLESEYARVLTNYALNRNLAYLYGKSAANARGMMQITERTFKLMDEKYPDIYFGEDHADCVTDQSKSLILAAVLIDENLDTLFKGGSGLKRADYLDFKNRGVRDYFPSALAVMYNSGNKHVSSGGLKSTASINALTLPLETQIYLKKVRFVWDKILRATLGESYKKAVDAILPPANIAETPIKKNPALADRLPRLNKGESRLDRLDARARNTSINDSNIDALARATGRGKKWRLNYEKRLARMAQKAGKAERFKDFESMRTAVKAGRLISTANIKNLKIDDDIGREWRASEADRPLLTYLNPIAAHNLRVIAAWMGRELGVQMRLSSASRTTQYVAEMRKTNPRATPGSSHEYGTTFDFTYRPVRYTENGQTLIWPALTEIQRKKLEEFLIGLQKNKKILFIKESVCFHVFNQEKI